jgi:hypothetical protein
LIIWVIAGLLGLATGLRIGWALVNKQSLVSAAMILALGSLGLVAALNWQPLTLLLDTLLRWPNVSTVLSQVALISCAAGSCVMITSASSSRSPVTTRRIAVVQYGVAALIAAVTLVAFFISPQQPEMAPEEFLRRNLDPGGAPTLSWLPPLLYVLFALCLVVWAGVRHSNRTRRGRALFVFTIGIVLIVLAAAFFLLRAAGSTQFVGVGSAATLLGCAMLVVASGSLLPSVEDWFGARREMRLIRPLLDELHERHPNVGIGIRPRGPLLFRVAEQMSMISDALYLEATRTLGDDAERAARVPDPELPKTSPNEQARRVAAWIHAGRGVDRDVANVKFPGPNWLRQPASYSDREWILAIASQYRALERSADEVAVG